jgi:hypothetical protein
MVTALSKVQPEMQACREMNGNKPQNAGTNKAGTSIAADFLHALSL